MPPPLGAGGIMFSGCPSVRPSVWSLFPSEDPLSICTWVRWSIRPTVTIYFAACPSVCPFLCLSIHELDCTTYNLIYLIECTKCHIQYIGETSQPLSGPFSDHKSRIRNHNATKKETLLIDHFNNGTCKGMDYNVNIIETIQQPAKIGQMLESSYYKLKTETKRFLDGRISYHLPIWTE